MDAALTDRILSETRHQLRDGGYAQLRIERVAHAIGCGKTAIYRRWPTKGDLVVAALVSGMEHAPPPDTGDVVQDLMRHCLRSVTDQQSNRDQLLEQQLSSEDRVWTAVLEPEVRGRFWSAFLQHRRSAGRWIIGNAVGRGELPADTDADALLDAIAGLSFYRTTVRQTSTPESLREAVIRALVANPPRAAEPA